jgi:hypothetical protein
MEVWLYLWEMGLQSMALDTWHSQDQGKAKLMSLIKENNIFVQHLKKTSKFM